MAVSRAMVLRAAAHVAVWLPFLTAVAGSVRGDWRVVGDGAGIASQSGHRWWWPVLVITASVAAQAHLMFALASAAVVLLALTIDLDGGDTRTVRRTTTQAVRSFKAQQPRKAAHVS